MPHAQRPLYVVEVKQYGQWCGVSHCFTREQADRAATAPHILAVGETRVREYGKAFDPSATHHES